MKNTTQTKWVMAKLRNDGYVTRNEALQQYISRLGAIILNLKDNGWQIEGGYEKTANGKDYKYKLVTAPRQIAFKEVINPDGSRVMVQI